VYTCVIAVVYCGLVVHITDAIIDTRAQKMASHTVAQHWQEQKTLTAPQLYRHSQEYNKWLVIH